MRAGRVITGDQKPAPTAIRVPDLDPDVAITFGLDAGDIVISASVTLTAPVWETFPGDVAGHPDLGHLRGLEADEWLGEDHPPLEEIIEAALTSGGSNLSNGEFVDEYLRRHAEKALNEVATHIRMKRWDEIEARGEKRSEQYAERASA
jgi:hypothetical protein